MWRPAKKPSVAEAGQGIGNAEHVQILHEKEKGRNYLIIRWDGGEYKGATCWIRAPKENCYELDKML